MSNAWTVAFRPVAGLRSLALQLPPWSIARLTVSRLTSPRTAPAYLSRVGTAQLQCCGFRPPLLRALETRQFSTSSVFAARRPRKPAPPADSKISKPSKPSNDEPEKEDTPLPGGNLPKEKISEIFGAGVSAKHGNALLRALQHRRVTGSLAEKGVHFDDTAAAAIPKDRALNALEYLRTTYPVDEEAAAAEWAEREAQKLEGELIERAQKLGIYKKAEKPQTQESLYGHSELEALRRRNEELYEQQESLKKEREAQEAAKAEKSGTLGPVKSRVELGARKKEKSEFVKYYEEQAVLRKEKEAPQMSAAARILPSLAVASVALALLYYLTQNYVPPAKSARFWPDTPPALATCVTILNLNLLVFLAWRIPPFWRTLNRFFLQTPGYPTAVSVVGNIFSHQEPKHLLWNMLILMGAGPQLHDLVGRADFLAIYLGGGIVGSAASLIYFVATKNFAVSTLGASGALAATIGALLLLKDADHITLPGLPDWQLPVASRALLGACLAYELWGLSRGRGATGMDHVAHLGGYATGMAGAGAIRYQLAERRRIAEEKKSQMGFLQKTFTKE